jgi:hypothetical protein
VPRLSFEGRQMRCLLRRKKKERTTVQPSYNPPPQTTSPQHHHRRSLTMPPNDTDAHAERTIACRYALVSFCVPGHLSSGMDNRRQISGENCRNLDIPAVWQRKKNMFYKFPCDKKEYLGGPPSLRGLYAWNHLHAGNAYELSFEQ